MTTKGELVRAILFPPPLDFQFHSDFLKSIYVFLILGLIGMSYSLWMWISKGVKTRQNSFKLIFLLFWQPVYYFGTRLWQS